MSSKMIYARPIPVNRAVNAISDSAYMIPLSMKCTQEADSLLFDYATNRGAIQHTNVRKTALRCWFPSCRIRCAWPFQLQMVPFPEIMTYTSFSQETGPHLFEFSPSGVTYEYYAMAIGARSQSAKTYLERHFEEFADCKSSYLCFISILLLIIC